MHRTLASRAPRTFSLAALWMVAPLATAGGSESPGFAAGHAESTMTEVLRAHARQRHAAVAVADELRAENVGQRWSIEFDGRGVRVLPRLGNWSWGLELDSYGVGTLGPVGDRALCVASDGERVSYDWDERLEEWFINGPNGLEHGFTVRERPLASGPAGDAPLCLAFSVRGGLCAELSADSRSVSFVGESGSVRLRYDDLHAFDAQGTALDAWIEVDDGTLRLFVDERAAEYPITIDPLAQQAYLKPLVIDDVDMFGYRVETDGETILIATSMEDSASKTNALNNSAPYAGAAYVFSRSSGEWVQEAYLKAGHPDTDDYFGHMRPGISGDLIAVGSVKEDSLATGINGNSADNSGWMVGAVYVYHRSGSVWTQDAYIKASNAESGDDFGNLALDGNTLMVCAPGEDSGDVNDPADNSVDRAGAVYVFERIGGVWSQQAYLKSPTPTEDEAFGGSVELDGDFALISTRDPESVHVFHRIGGVWTHEAVLAPSLPIYNDDYGWGLGLSGDVAVVGAFGDSSGVIGDPTDNSMASAGAAYVFRRSGTSWSQEAYLKHPDPNPGDAFGFSVDIDGDRILIGAWGDDGSAIGLGGSPHVDGIGMSGAALLYRYAGGAWSFEEYIKSSNSNQRDQFGYALSLENDLMVVGAPWEDSRSVGVNGDQTDNSGDYNGAAYVFDLGVAATPFCFGDATDGVPCPCGNESELGAGEGCVNTQGHGAVLTALGSDSYAADDLVLMITQGRGNQPAMFLQGSMPAAMPFKDGKLCVGTPTERLEAITLDGTGAGVSVGSIVTEGAVPGPGTTLYYQAWYRDPQSSVCGTGSNLTGALKVDWR